MKTTQIFPFRESVSNVHAFIDLLWISTLWAFLRNRRQYKCSYPKASWNALNVPFCPKKGKTKPLHIFISKYCSLSWAAQVAPWLKKIKKKKSACQCRRCRTGGFDPWVGKIPWRRKWQPTLLFLPEKSHGQRSLEGYSPWGCKVRHDRAHMQFKLLLGLGSCSHHHPLPHLPVYLVFFLSTRIGGSQKPISENLFTIPYFWDKHLCPQNTPFLKASEPASLLHIALLIHSCRQMSTPDFIYSEK